MRKSSVNGETRLGMSTERFYRMRPFQSQTGCRLEIIWKKLRPVLFDTYSGYDSSNLARSQRVGKVASTPRAFTLIGNIRMPKALLGQDRTTRVPDDYLALTTLFLLRCNAIASNNQRGPYGAHNAFVSHLLMS